MSNNLAIDLGNSSAKIYVFNDAQLIDSRRSEAVTVQHIERIFFDHNIENVIISSVKGDSDIYDAVRALHPNRLINLDANTPIPLSICYGTPATLGHDRIATAVGAASLQPGQNILVADLGTAITLDVVTAEGKFLGGNISPGMHTRFTALHQFTAKLPMVSPDGEIPLIGNSTDTAIRAGVIRGIASEINGFAEELQQQFQKLIIFITGGDAKYLAKWIKYPIFDEQFLLARGLNTILLYNI